MDKSGKIDFNNPESIKKIAKDTTKSINKNLDSSSSLSPKIMEFVMKHHKPILAFGLWFLLFGISSNIYYLVQIIRYIISLF